MNPWIWQLYSPDKYVCNLFITKPLGFVTSYSVDCMAMASRSFRVVLTCFDHGPVRSIGPISLTISWSVHWFYNVHCSRNTIKCKIISTALVIVSIVAYVGPWPIDHFVRFVRSIGASLTYHFMVGKLLHHCRDTIEYKRIVPYGKLCTIFRPSDAYMRRWTNHHWFR